MAGAAYSHYLAVFVLVALFVSGLVVFGRQTGKFPIIGAETGVPKSMPLLQMEKQGFRLERTRRYDGIVPLVLLTYDSVDPAG